MADPENFEDDLFDDLYDDDEPTAAPAQAPAPAPVAVPEPEPQTALPVVDSSSTVPPVAQPPAPLQQQHVDTTAQDNGEYGYGGDANMGGYGGDDYEQEPIGMKEDGKMFIGGLNWETTDQSLKDYFSQFGEVLECTVMRDGATGRSRGFGFLTFKDPKTVNIVMVKEHYLDGKIIDPKRAIPREEQERTAKIFVGGVSQECTETYFREFFMKFGRVIDATLMMDKDTGRPRGFGFVTFDGDDAVDRTLAGPLAIHNKPIEVKRAEPRGNVHDEKSGPGGGKFAKRGGGRGEQNFDNQGGGGGEQYGAGAGQGGAGNTNGMSQAQMAGYWFRMQEYFRNMQQAMARNMATQNQMGAMNPAMMGGMGGMGGMNPAMMQQMMMAQAGQQQRMMSPAGGMNGPMSPGIQAGGTPNPMQQAGNGAYSDNGAGGQMMGREDSSGSGQAGFTSHEQMAFEQQKYEKQQMARMQQQQYAAQQGGFQNPTAWEGMYDDVPAPNMPTGPSGNRGNFRGRRGGGHVGGDRGHGGGNAPPNAPAAPANAPTGPKNAGRPGANYRGGGRGGNNRGYRPY